jgi:outer membrane protein assembly factor BamB
MIAAILFTHSVNKAQPSELIWPQFRGPNCSGHAAEGQNLPINFGPEQNLLWKTPVPSGHSSPCIWGDRIFLTGFDKEKKELQVFCIDRNSGNIRWSRIVPVKQIERVHSMNSPASTTPVADGERIYVYLGSFGLLCYDFDGKQEWEIPMPLPIGNGHCTSPIIFGELVILNHEINLNPFLLGVDRKSGKTAWKQIRKGRYASQSTPIIWDKQLVIHRNKNIEAYNPADGTPIWSVYADTSGTSTPVIGNNVLFVGTWGVRGEPSQRVKLPDFKTLVKQCDKNGDMKISRREFPEDFALRLRPEIENYEGANFYIKPIFARFDLNRDGLYDEGEWGKVVTRSLWGKDHGLVAIQPGGKGDITATHVLWQHKRDIPEVPSPIYYDGRIYMIKSGGIVTCMDAATGKLHYRERLGAAGLYCSSPVIANERIYITSAKGVVTVFKTGETLDIIAQNKLGERIYSTPAIVDNKLYIRTFEHLYAFGE